MRKTILLTTIALAALWGQALFARDATPKQSQSTGDIQRPLRKHDGTGPYHAQVVKSGPMARFNRSGFGNRLGNRPGNAGPNRLGKGQGRRNGTCTRTPGMGRGGRGGGRGGHR